jgi:hypothetical protein
MARIAQAADGMSDRVALQTAFSSAHGETLAFRLAALAEALLDSPGLE